MYGKKILQKFLIGTKESKCSKEPPWLATNAEFY